MQHEPIGPCPHCAGVGVVMTKDDATHGPIDMAAINDNEDGIQATARVFCHECGAEGPPVRHLVYFDEEVPDIEAQAVRFWNGRASVPPPPPTPPLPPSSRPMSP